MTAFTPLIYLQTMHKLTHALLRIENLDDMLQRIVDEASQLLQAPYSEIMLLDSEGALVVRACTKNQTPIKHERIVRPTARLAWLAFDTGEPAVLEDYARWEHRRAVYSEDTHAVMDIPIMTPNGCIGLLGLGRTQTHSPFSLIEIEEGKLLAQLVAMALEKVHWRETVATAQYTDRQSSLRMRALTDIMRELVAVVDANGIIVYASPSYQDGLGYSPNELIGRNAFDFIYPEDVDHVRDLFKRTFSDNPSGKSLVEFRCMHAGGYPIWIESSGSPIFDENGVATSILTVFRDISERRQVETLRRDRERLQAALQKEQELSNLKGAMMARIGHEFRTPLATIQTGFELLTRYLERLTPQQREERFHAIKAQITHLTSMLDGIRSAIGTGKGLTVSTFKDVNVEALCIDLIHEINELRNLPISFHAASASITILCDEELLATAIRQVLLNAVRYSDHDRPITMDLMQAPDGVTIRVIDAGIGILAEDLPRVFEPFFRGSNIDEINGLGIGLTLARAAMNAHNGTIHIISEVDKGTIVTLRIPDVTMGLRDGAG